jgi:SAM-dependent methyltransferase
MNTDSEWEAWGRQDPYFGVITDPKFRNSQLTAEARKEFFDSGYAHADYVMQMIRLHIGANFQPQSILDFGCGVGRLVVPFSKIATEVVGMDVSSAMLREARKNCDEQGIHNVQLLLSDDNLSRLTRQFDLIHSYIVFQHIPPERGRTIFRNLLRHIPVGGVGAFHFCYSKSRYEETYGVAPQPLPHVNLSTAQEPRFQDPLPPGTDPEMQMNCYPLNELFFLLQKSGVSRFHVEFTDHGGELGALVFFQKSN